MQKSLLPPNEASCTVIEEPFSDKEGSIFMYLSTSCWQKRPSFCAFMRIETLNIKNFVERFGFACGLRDPICRSSRGRLFDFAKEICQFTCSNPRGEHRLRLGHREDSKKRSFKRIQTLQWWLEHQRSALLGREFSSPIHRFI